MKRNSFVATISVAVLATFSVGFVNVTPKVIYGDDNRVDVYEVTRSDIRDIADSTVALIPSRDVVNKNNGYFEILTEKYGTQMNLCADEPYYHQPVAANCSGSLVGEDLIATAGHCISASDCINNSYSFVFGFKMTDAKTGPQMISTDDVFTCKEIVAREYTGSQDYALVRLDRAVRGHRVLKLQQTPAQPGDQIYVVGHPAGLPTKVADGAEVRAQNGNYFSSNLDTYGGNSGSAVFNAATNEVVGILVRGAQDFAYDRANKCTRSNVCTNDSCRGEDVTNISYIVQALNQ
ncbi:trypsin-like serine peptidase [Bdellovibrio reynosensis]|uniref:Serine protease n=1 Tax=Bdellovibrio reynosensis TaxID=2835041 RepID=A0ABY4CAQ2_9BACT|nr:serine protease [Bdellovibrio reynosensis]UOF02048.1 serine protease [Bdellovibrio reynosensis]